MTTHQYISVRESAQILGVSEKTVMDLIENRQLQAYKIADKFLRLKKSDVQALRNAGGVESDDKPIAYTTAEKVRDFFYYNDFYLFAGSLVIALLYVIFYT